MLKKIEAISDLYLKQVLMKKNKIVRLINPYSNIQYIYS